MTQLTSKEACARKHTYRSQKTATRAKKRRNATGRFFFTAAYQCNVCKLWHLTTQIQEGTTESGRENRI